MLKGCSFDTTDDKIKVVKKFVEAFQDFFVKQKDYWEKCLNRGEYFEGDKDQQYVNRIMIKKYSCYFLNRSNSDTTNATKPYIKKYPWSKQY